MKLIYNIYNTNYIQEILGLQQLQFMMFRSYGTTHKKYKIALKCISDLLFSVMRNTTNCQLVCSVQRMNTLIINNIYFNSCRKELFTL